MESFLVSACIRLFTFYCFGNIAAVFSACINQYKVASYRYDGSSCHCISDNTGLLMAVSTGSKSINKRGISKNVGILGSYLLYRYVI